PVTRSRWPRTPAGSASRAAGCTWWTRCATSGAAPSRGPWGRLSGPCSQPPIPAEAGADLREAALAAITVALQSPLLYVSGGCGSGRVVRRFPLNHQSKLEAFKAKTLVQVGGSHGKASEGATGFARGDDEEGGPQAIRGGLPHTARGGGDPRRVRKAGV